MQTSTDAILIVLCFGCCVITRVACVAKNVYIRTTHYTRRARLVQHFARTEGLVLPGYYLCVVWSVARGDLKTAETILGVLICVTTTISLLVIRPDAAHIFPRVVLQVTYTILLSAVGAHGVPAQVMRSMLIFYTLMLLSSMTAREPTVLNKKRV
jgi:hypothetical protein